MQKEILSHKLGDHAYEYQNAFGLKEDNLSQRNFQNQLSHPGLSHTEQKHQESLIQGKIRNQHQTNANLVLLQQSLLLILTSQMADTYVQNQSPGVVFKKRCSWVFRKIHGKTPVAESLF